MSTSLARIEANRENSQLSTGPKTPEGKEISSRNSTRHGFLASILPAEKHEYVLLLQALHVDLQPEGVLQELLVEEIALGYIRIRRIHSYEMKNFESYEYEVEVGYGPQRRKEMQKTYPICTESYFRLKSTPLTLRYQTSCERHINRCLSRLKEMKGDRVWKTLPKGEALEAVLAESLADENGPEDTTSTPSQLTGNQPAGALPSAPPDSNSSPESIGFVSQNGNDESAEPEVGFVSQKSHSESAEAELGFVSQKSPSVPSVTDVPSVPQKGFVRQNRNSRRNRRRNQEHYIEDPFSFAAYRDRHSK